VLTRYLAASGRWRRVFLLAGLLMLAQPALSHPDLLLQIEELDGQLQAEPQNAELLGRRGDLYRRHEDYAAAASDFAAARSSGQDYALLDFYEARLLLATGEWTAAEQLLSRYLSSHPGHAFAWTLRAQAWLGLGQPLLAAGDFEAAIQKADQPSPSLYRDWALALVTVGNDHWNEAGHVVDKALEAFPRDVALLALGTDIALAENQPSRANLYLKSLPGSVSVLPRWDERQRLLSCLQGAGPGEIKADCRQTAIRQLQAQAFKPGA